MSRSLVALFTLLALLTPSSPSATSPPSVSLRVAPWVFSPNGDGRKDTTAITVIPDRPAELTLSVERRSDGKRVRSLATDVVIDAAFTVTWRGREGSMRRAPDGRYRAVAVIVDPVFGGTAVARARLAIDTVPPALGRLRVSPDPWTGSEGVHLDFNLADAGPGTSYAVAFTVRDATDRLVRHVMHLVRRRGGGSVTWDARNRAGGHIPNGGYAFALRAKDEAGNTRVTGGVPFRLARPVSARIVSYVADAGRRVALTFDDCGNGDAWRRILTTLHADEAGATFFCVGTSVARWPRIARRTGWLGMTVGNHTWGHVDLGTASRDTIIQQIQQDGGVWWQEARTTPLPYLRPPNASYDSRVVDVAGSLGYRWIVLWNVDPRDWSGISASAIAQRVLEDTHPGAIVVLHVGSATADALPAILAGLAARRLTPVTLTTLLRSGTPMAGWWGR